MKTNFAWNEISAILGGRFDPPHRGHLEAIDSLFKIPGVQRVVVLPSASPPHKPAQAPFEDRLAFCRLLAAESRTHGKVDVDPREDRIQRYNPNQPTWSYTVIQDLKRDFPRLAFVIGSDQLETLSTWHRFPEVLELCHWIVLARRPWQPEGPMSAIQKLEENRLISRTSPHPGHLGNWTVRSGQGSGPQLALVPTDALAISSTEIRKALARTGEAPSGSLIPSVELELKRRRIYGIKAASSPSRKQE